MNERRTLLKTALSVGVGVSISGCLRVLDNNGQSDQENQSNEPSQTENSGGGTEENQDDDSRDVTGLSVSFHNPSYSSSVSSQSGQYLDTIYTHPKFNGVIAAGEEGAIGRHTPKGDTVWRDDLENQLYRTAIIGSQSNGTTLTHVVDAGLSVYTFDVETGEQLWQTDSILAENLSEDQFGRGVLELVNNTIIGFFNTSAGSETLTTIEGFAPDTGERLWVTRPAEQDDTYDHLAWGSSENAPLPGNRILFDMANRMGSINENGELQWKPGIKDAIGGIYTPTIADDETVYLPTGSVLIKYNPDSEATIWRYSAFDQITSPITLHNDTVLFGAEDNGVYAVDVTSGEQIWRFQTDNYIRAPPIVLGQTVYIGSTDQTVYGVDLNQGNEQSSIGLDGAIGTMEYSDDTIYVGTEAGIYGLTVSE